MTLQDLPALNASLNGAATILILTGFALVKAGKHKGHSICMMLAILVSAAFLVSYLIYHFNKPGVHTVFQGQGWIRPAYYTMLISHILLAIVNLPLILMTVIPAVKGNFARHRAMARWAYPIWLYVSVTGVLVYFTLYHWYPS
jgi:putative membrane protein